MFVVLKQQQWIATKLKLRAKIRSKKNLSWQPHRTSENLHGIRANGGLDLLIFEHFRGQFRADFGQLVDRVCGQLVSRFVGLIFDTCGQPLFTPAWTGVRL